jgi:hypothetical protein
MNLLFKTHKNLQNKLKKVEFNNKTLILVLFMYL